MSGGGIPLVRPLVMGIVNTTPDSFSDGGRYADRDSAVRHGKDLARSGADVVDVGGESSRPGAEPVPERVEIDRTMDVVAALAGGGLVVSIDTTKPAVAEAALTAGARIINDIGGLRDSRMRRLAADSGAAVVIMHMRGTPATMQEDPRYDDVVAEVCSFLIERIDTAVAAGVDPACIAVDPGIGFAKSADHNLQVLRRLDEVAALGFPVMIGASRKRFLGHVTGRDRPTERDHATAAVTAVAVTAGAMLLRVHDAALTVEAARVGWAIVRETVAPWGPVAIEEGTPT